MPLILCRERPLPPDRMEAALRRAVAINPENDRDRRRVTLTPAGRVGGPRRIVVVTARRWPRTGVRLSVSFLDGASAALRKRILLHMNAWGRKANVTFAETDGVGQVRIARLDRPAKVAGYWSYIGTEILEIDEDEPTMNLEGFSARTSESEFRRVVRHEAGHTLGFEHEHMRTDIVKRIDRAKAFAYFDREEGWSRKDVEEQVLTPLSKRSLMGTTESDPLSIMCYQLPAEIMTDGIEIPGGVDINPRDADFAASLYPKRRPRAPGDTDTPGTPDAPGPTPAAVVAVRPAPPEERDTFHLIVMGEFRPDADGRAAKGATSPEYAPVLASYGGARVTSMMRLRRSARGQAPTEFGRIIATHTNIKNYTNGTGGSLPDEEGLLDFGRGLFDTLFQGDVRRLYDEARSRQHCRLDFVLTSMIPWISEKPWEFAYDATRRSFLATEEIHFVRNVLTSVPADPIVRPGGPLRILVAAAQPVGQVPLSAEQEIRVLQRGFQKLIDAGLATIDILPRATPERLHEQLKTGLHQVVHFIGHGVFDEERGEGCLVFENDRGGEYKLGERQVRELLCKRGLSLVFLNSCESGRGGRADFNKGVAQALVAHGLPALVANQYSVLDASATTFAQAFYLAVAQGHPVGAAAREARIAVNYSLHGEVIDWAVPVLYARDPGMKLVDASPGAAVRGLAARDETAPPRRAANVAVWDVDGVLPALEQTLDALSGGQAVFGFRLEELSAPMDGWDLDTEEGQRFLWAEKAARRLQATAASLQADLLVCIT
ncbi:MAG TPA: CHAT domain-containing protein, partial [Vicinamibacteria bacterium]|nr:CHAT domain-containing protein [Vicinamibacteria bacterium]